MITRIWEGKKECLDYSYFCGQMWDAEHQLWVTVTANFPTEQLAQAALDEYLSLLA